MYNYNREFLDKNSHRRYRNTTRYKWISHEEEDIVFYLFYFNILLSYCLYKTIKEKRLSAAYFKVT